MRSSREAKLRNDSSSPEVLWEGPNIIYRSALLHPSLVAKTSDLSSARRSRRSGQGPNMRVAFGLKFGLDSDFFGLYFVIGPVEEVAVVGQKY